MIIYIIYSEIYIILAFFILLRELLCNKMGGRDRLGV